MGGLYDQVSGGQGIPLCIRWKMGVCECARCITQFQLSFVMVYRIVKEKLVTNGKKY